MERSLILSVISLIKSALTGEMTQLPEDFDKVSAVQIARSHRVIPLYYYGLINSDFGNSPEYLKRLFALTCQAVTVGEQQMAELEWMSETFEKNGIDHLVLKGSVIRSLYPKQEMRSMSDADVLIKFDQYDKIVPLLEEHGLQFVKENLNELCWEKTPFYVELHRYLVSPRHTDLYSYFGDGWKLAKPVEGKAHTFVMSDEDFYVFLFVHFAKHYRSSGIGIKHLVDFWIYLKEKKDLDIAYVRQELEKLKLLTFYDNVMRTLRAWFDGEAFDEVTWFITEKVFASSAFGTVESAKTSEALKDIKSGEVKNVKLNRSLRLMFPPYKNMCIAFPILKKMPILLPFLWIYRGVRALFCKKDMISQQLESIQKLRSDKIDQYQKELNMVGLDYNFEE